MRLLLTGASGQLGAYLLRELARQGDIVVCAWSGSTVGERFGVPLRPVDLSRVDHVAEAFSEARPDVVLHAAALARVGECHREPVRAHRVNVAASAALAALADAARARFVQVSTDLVFDGERGGYRETDEPSPVSVYGRSKADAEAAVLTLSRTAIARLSLLHGTSLCGRPSFFDEQIAALRGGRAVTLFTDEWRTPLDLSTAARALLALTRSDFTGLLHLGGPERLSRWEMGERLATVLGTKTSGLIAMTRGQAPAPEPRPRNTSLDSSRWRSLFPEVPWPSYYEALRSQVSTGDVVPVENRNV
jgi:dTDP-4-dehydrorhamnose reductase